MTEVGHDATPIANPMVVLPEKLDDWAVLCNPDSAAADGTSPGGVVIGKLLDGRTPLAAVAATLRDRFDEVPGTVEDEVQAFVADLLARGFLGRVGESAPE